MLGPRRPDRLKFDESTKAGSQELQAGVIKKNMPRIGKPIAKLLQSGKAAGIFSVVPETEMVDTILEAIHSGGEGKPDDQDESFGGSNDALATTNLHSCQEVTPHEVSQLHSQLKLPVVLLQTTTQPAPYEEVSCDVAASSSCTTSDTLLQQYPLSVLPFCMEAFGNTVTCPTLGAEVGDTALIDSKDGPDIATTRGATHFPSGIWIWLNNRRRLVLHHLMRSISPPLHFHYYRVGTFQPLILWRALMT